MSATRGNRSLSKSLRKELTGLLGALLEERDHGLITQGEYDERLENLAASLPQDLTLVEFDLPHGGTRYAVRNHKTGISIDHFEFRRTYSPSE
jgi:hypothetical protein